MSSNKSKGKELLVSFSQEAIELGIQQEGEGKFLAEQLRAYRKAHRELLAYIKHFEHTEEEC